MSEAEERPVMAALRLFADPVGLNPTGRPRKPSARRRRRVERALEQDLKGTQWERKTD